MYKIVKASEFMKTIKVTSVKRLGNKQVLVNGQYYIKIGSKGMIRVEE